MGPTEKEQQEKLDRIEKELAENPPLFQFKQTLKKQPTNQSSLFHNRTNPSHVNTTPGNDFYISGYHP